MKKWKKVVLEYIRQDMKMVVIYCCLERENYKNFKFQGAPFLGAAIQ